MKSLMSIAILLILLACQPEPTQVPAVTSTPVLQPTPAPTPVPQSTPAPTSTSTPTEKLEAGIEAMYDCINAHGELREGIHAVYVDALMPAVERSAAEAAADLMLDSRLMFTKVMVSYVRNNPTEADVYIMLADMAHEDTEVACAEVAAEFEVEDYQPAK